MTYFGETAYTDGLYTVVTFLESGTFATPDGVIEGDCLIVAGGGSGGRGPGGGGGGGGVLTGTEDLSGTMTVTVGAGGDASSGLGNDGGNSEFGTLTAIGGGGGGSGSSTYNGRAGGSSGGSAFNASGVGAATTGQGHVGGLPGDSGDPGCGGGGGGGAGGDGQAGVSGSEAGDGGPGVSNSITGASVDYAGGGGSGIATGTAGHATHGGGAGSNSAATGTSGTANTGGGGGGGKYADSGAGGSGIVVVRYLTDVTYYGETPVIDGDYTVVRFLESGDFVTPDGVTEASKVLIVGGGAAGGTWCGGGGGAGEVVDKTAVALSGTMTVVVGDGGPAPTGNGDGDDGSDSSFAGFTAKGGGGGGSYVSSGSSGDGRAGGSGGGVGWHPAGTPGASTASDGVGHAGGHAASENCSAGGGGADTAGGDASFATGGSGGEGLSTTITGSTTYHGGGGGGFGITNKGAAPAHGGGGIGSNMSSSNGGAGVANSGGGGGGGWYQPMGSCGGAGGSGKVIIRYLTPGSSGQVTLAAVQARGVGTHNSPVSGAGQVSLAAARTSGTGSLVAPAYTAVGHMRTARLRCTGSGTVTAYSGGAHTGSGHVTLGGPTIRGVGHHTKNGNQPVPDPPPVPVPPWPPVTPTGTLTSSTHTLIGDIAISVGGVNYTPYAENLQFDSNVSGGYGSCSFNLRPPTPVPEFGGAIIVSSSHGLLWEGNIVNTPGITYTGEFIHYEVIAEGPYTQYGRAEDFSWLGSDTDTSSGGSWQDIDCQNFPDGFEITTSTGLGLMFQSQDVAGTVKYRGTVKGATRKDGITTATEYTGYEGNTVPPPANQASEGQGAYSLDCLPPDAIWAAFYYWTPDSAPLTGLTGNLYCDLSTPLSDIEAVCDYDNGTPNSEGTWGPLLKPAAEPRYAWYPPTLNLWTGVLLLPELPGSMWAGIYACNDPRELRVNDPVWMWNDTAHLLYKVTPRTKTTQAVYAKCDPVTKVPILSTDPGYAGAEYVYDSYGNLTFEVEADAIPISVACSAQMLVLYATYHVVQTPMGDEGLFPAEDVAAHVAMAPWPHPYIRQQWWASNELRNEGAQYVQFRDVKVLANSQTGESADLGAAIAAASGSTNIGVITAAEGTDVKVEPFATRLAAIQQLVGMSAETLYWGWDPSFFCTTVRGTYTFDATIPGVTVAAAVKNEGTIDTATVVYTDTVGDTGGGVEDRRVLAAWVPTSETFDVNGDGQVEPGENSGLIDGSYLLHSSAAASAAAQSYIIERGISGDGPQWEGTITLRGIPGAAATKVGYAVNCGDVTGAIITAVSVDVDSDTVTLSLGGTGYIGRFPVITGQPNSAIPSNAAAYRKTLPWQTWKR